MICVGMGNNGNDALHTGGKLSPGEIQEIELGVGAFEPTLNVQLWKNYEDEMEIYLENQDMLACLQDLQKENARLNDLVEQRTRELEEKNKPMLQMVYEKVMEKKGK